MAVLRYFFKIIDNIEDLDNLDKSDEKDSLNPAAYF